MSKTKGIVLTAAERKEKALSYRKMGWSYEAIGQICGCSAQRAYTIVSEYLRELAARNTHAAEELRQLELEKLDAQEARLSEVILQLPAEKINLLAKFEDTLLKVRMHRAKLLGLVVPTQVLVPVPVGPEKGRVESVIGDPRLAEVVESATVWEPPAPLALTPAPEPVRGVG